jgi:Flp pilus assembly pilin Flp
LKRNQRFIASIKNQRGQSLVEYLIIMALVAVGTMAVMRSVGQNIKVQFTHVIQALGGKVEGRAEAETVSKSMYQRSDLKTFMRGSIGNKKAADQNDGETNDSSSNQ